MLQISAVLMSFLLFCQKANVALRLWLARVKFGEYVKNKYLRKSKLVGFREFGDFGNCRLDRFNI